VNFELGVAGAADHRLLRVTRLNPSVNVPAIDGRIRIVGITLDLPGFFDAFAGGAVEIVVNLFISVINNEWLPLIDRAVNTVLLAILPEFQLGLVNDGIPRNACISVFVDDISVENGDMSLEAGIGIEAGDFPNNDALGVRVSQYTPPTDRISADGNEYDTVVSLSTNIINQILFGMHKAGCLELTLPNIIVLNGRTLSARVIPKASSHFSMRQFELGISEFHIWDLEIAIEALLDEDNPEAGRETLASGVIRIDVPLDFAISEDVTLRRILSLFTDQVNASFTDISFTRGNRAFSPAEAAAVALAAAGPLLVIAADNLSELPIPFAGIELEPEDVPSIAFWVDPDEGALKLGVNLLDLIGTLLDPAPPGGPGGGGPGGGGPGGGIEDLLGTVLGGLLNGCPDF